MLYRRHEHYNVYVLLGFLWCICTDLKTGTTSITGKTRNFRVNERISAVKVFPE